MKRFWLLALTVFVGLMLFSPVIAENTEEEKQADLFSLWETNGENRTWIAAAVPFSEGVLITSPGELPESPEQITVSDGENFWETKAVIPDRTGMIALVFYDREDKTVNRGTWPLMPWGMSVPSASCTVRYADQEGRLNNCEVLAAEDIRMQERRFLLLTLTEPVQPGSAVLTGDGYLAGVVTAEWAEGINRVLALPAEEIAGSLQEAAALLNNLPEWGKAPEGLNVTMEKNRVTIDWRNMTLPEKAEGETLYMVLLDTGNNYLNFYPAETSERTFSTTLTPGRFYAVGPVASAGKPDDIPEMFTTFAVPQAQQLTDYGFHSVLTAIAEAPEEGETPVPVTEVTEVMLRSGRAYFYSHSAYEVTETVEGKTLLVTLTDPDGVNYIYRSSWVYMPEYMTEDIWYVPLKETGLTDALDRNGYPAGIYRMAYYVDGDLADEFEFELK